MEYLIETQNLTKTYGDFTAVDNVNLHVPKGKIYGLLGRNGAGKTTLMSMLLRLTEKTSGRVSLFQKNYQKNLNDVYRRIGSIIETPGFYQNLTGRENLEILARLRGIDKKDSVENALKVVALDKEHQKTFKNYSLGMKQRLGIAAAIMHQPELLILDEPINGLDPVGIALVRNYFEMLSKEKGVTILISSHILSEIEQMADVIGVMNKGRLVEEVSMEELHKRCNKYMEFNLSDVKGAVNILKESFNITHYEITDNTLYIYEDQSNIGKINKSFIEHGLIVTKADTKEDSLEDYFSNLIGGDNIA